ncbi:MAG: YbdK family carboxylate-amine ligase [Actinobacteria bacterium]|nr:YbdK family carboxylate-amine ligase [Actinomycetota bacterium]
MIEHRFGESDPLSLGIEEEIMILDARTFMPAPEVETLVRGSEQIELPGRLKTELHASVVELNTEVCRNGIEAFAALRALREAAAGIAAEHELAIAAAGAHPRAHAEDLVIVPEPRYLTFVEYAGISAIRQGVNGLHVHVGMPGPDESLHVLDGILPWLPLVLALSANSPYAGGEETGMASYRAEILGLLPRRGAPPGLASYAEWEELIESLVATGLVGDYTAIWWDARIHPKFGTLEIRTPDQPTSLALTAGFVALFQALCAHALAEPRRARGPGFRVIYDQNRWAASRFGPQARFIHPDDGRAVDGPELAAELLERISPYARELGTEELLEPITLDRCEGDVLLEVGRRDGLEAACRDLVARTVDFGRGGGSD